jgi:hypothetical protein
MDQSRPRHGSKQAQAWIKAGETLNNVITDESTVALEQFAQHCHRSKGRRSSKPPLKLHVWGAISRQGPGPYLIFDGKFGYLQSKRYIKYCRLQLSVPQ